MSDSTSRLGIQITAQQTDANASISQLNKTLKDLEDTLRSVGGSAVDAGGKISNALKEEINQIKVEISARSEQENSIKRVTRAIQEQGEAASATFRTLQQQLEISYGANTDRVIKSAADSAKVLATSLSAAAEADARLRTEIIATTKAIEEQATAIALAKKIQEDYANANWENRNFDQVMRSQRAEAEYINRDKDRVYSNQYRSANYENRDRDIIAEQKRKEAEYINRQLDLQYSNQYASANYENRNKDLIADRQRKEAEYTNAQLDAQYKNQYASASYENRDRDAQYKTQYAAASYENRDKDLAAAQTRREAEYENKDFDLRQAKARQASNEEIRAKQAEMLAARQAAEYENNAIDARMAKLRQEAEYENTIRDSAMAQARRQAEYENQQRDAALTNARASADYENRDRDLAYDHMRRMADYENAQWDAAHGRRGGSGRSTATSETRHLVALFDEASRGQKGAMFGTIGAAARDAGLGVASLTTSMAGLIAIAGTGYIIKETEALGKWARETRAAASAVGMSLQDYSGLQAVFTSMGEKANEADATLRHLSETLSQALSDPASKAADAFHNLGISQDMLVANGTNVRGALELLAQAFVETADDANKSANYQEIFGKGIEHVTQLLQKGKEGLDEATAAQERMGRTLDGPTAEALEKAEERIRAVGESIEGGAIKAFADWAPVIATVTEALGGLANMLLKVIGYAGEAAQKINSAYAAAPGIESGYLPGYGLDFSSPGTPKPSISAASMDPDAANSPAQKETKRTVPALDPVSAMSRLRQQMAQAGAAASSGTYSNRNAALQAEAKAEIDVLQQTLNTAKLTANERTQIETELAQKQTQLNNEKLTGESSANKQSYADFASNERLKISEAAGSASKILAIYDDWIAQATNKYKQSASTIAQIEREKVNEVNSAQLQQIEENTRQTNQVNQISKNRTELQSLLNGQYGISGEKTIGGVERNKGLNSGQLTAEADQVASNAQTTIAALQNIVSTSEQGSAAQRKASDDILSIIQSATAEELSLRKQAATAAQEAEKQSTEAVDKMFDKIGSQFSTFGTSLVDALIMPQTQQIKAGLTTIKTSLQGNEIATAARSLFKNIVNDLTNTLESGFSQLAAKSLSQLLSIPIQAGGGLSSLFASGLQQVFGLGTSSATNAAASATLVTAGTTLGTAGVGLNASAVALTTAAAALAAGGATSALGGAAGLMGDVGGLLVLSGGGIIPSAASGMIVGGMGGTLSLLHEQEMVLPKPISQGIQQMISRNNYGNNATMNFNSTNNFSPRSRQGTGMTRSEFTQAMASHGSSLMGEARQMIRQGWRPA